MIRTPDRTAPALPGRTGGRAARLSEVVKQPPGGGETTSRIGPKATDVNSPNPNFPIYLDHSATTPVDPRVFEAMRPYFSEVFGNPASKSHAFGWAAERAANVARNQVAALIGAEQEDVDSTGSREIVFTAGSTESNNFAIKGVADAYRDKGRHVITQATEHKSVLESCKHLARDGWDVTVLPVGRGGRVSPA